eukprot:2589448-Rhodomonas_salina.1
MTDEEDDSPLGRLSSSPRTAANPWSSVERGGGESERLALSSLSPPRRSHRWTLPARLSHGVSEEDASRWERMEGGKCCGRRARLDSEEHQTLEKGIRHPTAVSQTEWAACAGSASGVSRLCCQVACGKPPVLLERHGLRVKGSGLCLPHACFPKVVCKVNKQWWCPRG